MQDIKFYVAANSTLGTVRDYANAKTVNAPTLVRAIAACLRIRLFANSDGKTAYPLSAFSHVAAWKWSMDNKFGSTTTHKLDGDNADITVGSVSEAVDEETITYTEIAIPISNMNTDELKTWLGTEDRKKGLHGELVGTDTDGKEIFVLQVENFTVRNRINSVGNPTTANADYLTEVQVRGIIAAKADLVSHATAGNLAALDENGNLVDSGKPGNIRNTMFVPAGAMIPSTTSGATANTEESSTNKLTRDAMVFPGSGNDTSVEFDFPMPEDWNRGTIKYKVFWEAGGNAAAGEVVGFNLAAGAFSDGDALDAALGTAVTVGDAVVAAGGNHVTTASGELTVGGSPTFGDLVHFKLTRDYDYATGGTAMSANANVLGISIQYTQTEAIAEW